MNEREMRMGGGSVGIKERDRNEKGERERVEDIREIRGSTKEGKNEKRGRREKSGRK